MQDDYIYSNCSNCRYRRIVRTNLITLRWVTIGIVIVATLTILFADIFKENWHITEWVCVFYTVGVLGLVALAFGLKRNGYAK